MRIPSRPVRRMAIPLTVVALVVILALLLVSALVGAILAPFSPRRRPLRIAVFALAYVSMELAVLAASGALSMRKLVARLLGRRGDEWWIAAHQKVLSWALGWVIAAGARALAFRVVVTDSSNSALLTETQPVLVLARHGGPGDSFVLVHLLLTRFERGVRIVLKDLLQLDPALDIVLNRLGCCFLPSHAGPEGLARLTALARELRPRDALLIFPEGQNWTPGRHLRAIRHLRSRRQLEKVRTASLMPHVLPPRLGGVAACLDGNPELGVVVAAHAGLDRTVSARQVWEQLPLTTPMTTRFWPASPPPPGIEERAAWLTLEWAVVDQWIDAFHGGAVDQSATGAE